MPVPPLKLGPVVKLHGNKDQTAGGVLVVDSEFKAKRLISVAAKSDGPVAVDCETSGIDPTKESPVHRGSIVCWSVAWLDPSLPAHSTRGITLARRAFIPHWGQYEELLPLFRDFLREFPTVGHNVHSYDSHMFANEGVPLGNIVGDTLRQSKLYNPSKAIKHGLKPLASGCLGYDMFEIEDFASRPKHAVCHHQELETIKGQKYPVAWRDTHRKINGRRVPTTVASGELGKVYVPTETMELDELVRDYPQRIPSLIDYASLDVKVTLELYQLICAKMKERLI